MHGTLHASKAAGQPSLRDRLLIIDLLRFGAALMVVAYHLTPQIALRAGAPSLDQSGWEGTRYGWLGVHLFFIISGFVISMSSWGRSLGQFVTSRVARLWPAYVAGVLLTATALTVWPHAGEQRPPMSVVLTNLTMIQSLFRVPDVDPVYWSLIIELKFYLIFAVVVRAGATYRRVVVFCVAWLTGAALAAAARFTPLVVLLEPGWAPFFVGGITIYLIHRFGRSFLLWCMLAVSWILSVNSTIRTVDEHRGYGEELSTVVAGLFVTACFAVLLATALGWFRWARWRGLLTLGAMSYPIYLLHYQIGETAIRELPSVVRPWQAAIVTAGGLLVAAYAMNRFIERPGSKAVSRRLRASFDAIRLGDQPPTPAASRDDEPALIARPRAAPPEIEGASPVQIDNER